MSTAPEDRPASPALVAYLVDRLGRSGSYTWPWGLPVVGSVEELRTAGGYPPEADDGQVREDTEAAAAWLVARGRARWGTSAQFADRDWVYKDYDPIADAVRVLIDVPE